MEYYSYWYVISKSDDPIFIVHVTGETHELHKKVVSDKRHDGSQDERHKQVDVDGVARAVKLSTRENGTTDIKFPERYENYYCRFLILLE